MPLLHEFGLFVFILIIPFFAIVFVVAKLVRESKSNKQDKKQNQ